MPVLKAHKELLSEIRNIIIEARSYVHRSVNYTQIISNWLVGQLIVKEEQQGKNTAKYGDRIIEYLSERLTKEFGNGYSSTNLKYFRKFYLIFSKGHSVRDELNSDEKLKSHSVRDELKTKTGQGEYSKDIQVIIQTDNHPVKSLLSLNLSWTHYRLLLKIDNVDAREFYMREASDNNWSTRALERQINSLYYERLIASQKKSRVKTEAKKRTNILKPEDVLKDPMVLEFLQLRKDKTYLETELEAALLDHLQDFLLELGKGFAFITRQKHIRTQTKDFYIDLVFYNYLLKCFVLIDLKTRELRHGDIGQMDMYVRYYEDKERGDRDNPTIGIIMATEKDETIIKYSLLADSKQLFATKYKLYLPDEEELRREIEQSKMIFNLNK